MFLLLTLGVEESEASGRGQYERAPSAHTLTTSHPHAPIFHARLLDGEALGSVLGGLRAGLLC